MAATPHSILGASSAYRWMNCTPSAVYTKDMPDKPSPFAEEGTKAHAIAEKRLNHFIDTGGDIPQPAGMSDEELDMWTNVSIYVSHCLDLFSSLQEKNPDTVMFVEQQVDFSLWVPGGYGTADCVILSGSDLYVRDLKYGKGVPVSAIENPQARCYGLGALAAFRDLYNISTVHNQIDQVRLEDGQSEEVISTEELLKWADEILAPAAQLASQGKGEFKAGPWCRFCKAGATCPHRAEQGNAVIAQSGHDVSTLTDEQISRILSVKDNVEKWMNSIEQYAIERAQNGDPVPGWKLVEGRSVRRWSDELAVQKRLEDNGFQEAEFTERKLYGITKMTAAVGGKKEFNRLLGDLVIKPAGKPTLVPDSDSRPALEKPKAIDDFK
jgi:hypothetical protein